MLGIGERTLYRKIKEYQMPEYVYAECSLMVGLKSSLVMFRRGTRPAVTRPRWLETLIEFAMVPRPTPAVLPTMSGPHNGRTFSGSMACL